MRMKPSGPMPFSGTAMIDSTLTPYDSAIRLSGFSDSAVWMMPVRFGRRSFWPGTISSELTTSGLLLCASISTADRCSLPSRP